MLLSTFFNFQTQIQVQQNLVSHRISTILITDTKIFECAMGLAMFPLFVPRLVHFRIVEETNSGESHPRYELET